MGNKHKQLIESDRSIDRKLVSKAYKWYEKRVWNRTIVEIYLQNKVVQELSPKDKFLGGFGGESRKVGLHDIVQSLEQAARDGRVGAVIIRLGETRMSYAQAEEIREAIRRFRAATSDRKPVAAWADSYDGITYYVASACSRVFLAQCGDLDFSGVRLDVFFVKNMLQKLGIDKQIEQRKEYKNAANMFNEEEFTDAHREVSESLVRSIHEQVLHDIAADRKIPQDDLERTLDAAPLVAQKALEANLVDELAYRDAAYEKLAMAAFGSPSLAKVNLLFAEKYLDKRGRDYDRKKGKHRIAVIDCLGQVARSESQSHGGGGLLGAETTCRAIRAACKDKKVSAILLRVDSPGGSYIGSDLIWNEVEQAKKAGKKVVVTMGQLAASGGYYISCAADRIVAANLTLTGSIGVYGGKVITPEMWKKLGVTFDGVKAGQNATFHSSLHRFSESELALLNAWLDRVYQDFLSKVSRGRGMTLEQVESVARGRIWTGKQAKQAGLVDEIGGFSRALAVAKQISGIPETEPVQLVYPARIKTFAQFLKHRKASNTDSVSANPAGIGSAIAALESASIFLAPAIRILSSISSSVDSHVLSNSSTAAFE